MDCIEHNFIARKCSHNGAAALGLVQTVCQKIAFFDPLLGTPQSVTLDYQYNL